MAMRDPTLGKRTVKASSKLRSTDNAGEMALPSHQVAHDLATAAITGAAETEPARTSQAVTPKPKNGARPPTSTTTTPTAPPSGPSTTAPATVEEDAGLDEENIPRPKKRKSAPILIDSEDEDSSANGPAPSSKRTKPVEVDSSDPEEIPRPALKKTRDLDAFFGPPTTVSGHSTPMRVCLLCSKKGPQKLTVHDVSTCRRHIESYHEGKYNNWCTQNAFVSKLPKAVKARTAKLKEAEALKQAQLDPHLKDRVPEEPKVIYTDALFREAAIEWLVATDQPIQALENDKFRRMIEIASKATKSIAIPSRTTTRKYIIDMFHTRMSDLRTRLMSDNVGLISLTCDAWQASNADAYFAVTGHWNEKMPNGEWKEHSTLLGFVQMNSAHDGITLGQALYKIIKRLGIGAKIGWITCDNASNNIAMLRHFEHLLNKSKMRLKCLKRWEWIVYHIRCLAHVINLSSQAVLSTYSNTNHFDVADPYAHEPDVEAFDRDEVGLVRAITVKARSSSKRKERLAILQKRAGIMKNLMLLLDMKVRWSSTHLMLKRAVVLKQFLNDFIYELSREESDLRKRRKIDALILRDEEWERVLMLIKILEWAIALHGMASSLF